MTEAELLLRIKENPGLFSELFHWYYQPIFGYIFRRTGEFDDAADIAAETFLKAFQHIKNFNYRGISIKVWLYRIATNEINLYYRGRHKHDKMFEPNGIADAEKFRKYIEEDKAMLEKELQQHTQFLSVLQHLKELPMKYQEVIALRYFEGKDNREIAEILGIKEGTLKSILSRGLEKLRNQCNPI